MVGMEATQDLFNCYRLIKVEYVFFISACYSAGHLWNPGIGILRAVTSRTSQQEMTPYSPLHPCSPIASITSCLLREEELNPRTQMWDQQTYRDRPESLYFPSTSRTMRTPLTSPTTTNPLFRSIPRLEEITPPGEDSLNIDTNSNPGPSSHTLFIPFIVKYTVGFYGRRWLPTLPSSDHRLFSRHLLGTNKLGTGPHMGTGAVKPRFHGHDGSKHIVKPSTSVQDQSGTTPSLADQDESSDQEDSISFTHKTQMLGGSNNRYWRGHTTGSYKEVHPLYKGKRCSYNREGHTIPYPLSKESAYKERGDHGDGDGQEKVLRDMAKVSSATSTRIQTGEISSTEGI